MVSHCLIASLSRRHELRSKRFSANLSGLICVGYPRCVHTDPPVASAGWTEKEAIAAGHTIEVLEETIRLVTDDDRSVVDPEPIKIKLVLQPETRTLLGCQAVGTKAAEIVNLAAAALSTGLPVTTLAELAMVHPSGSEALVRCLQSRFDRPARSTPSTDP